MQTTQSQNSKLINSINENESRIIKSSDFSSLELLKAFEDSLEDLKAKGYNISVSYGMGSVPYAVYQISKA